MRKLASVQTVDALMHIEGRDRIELARILGWQVIIKKGEFNVGDKCVYIEIDSVLPEREEFEFLRSKNFRIKTMKMAGVVSQGICFPMSVLPEREYQIGDDVTDVLGVTQYEPEVDDQVPKEQPVKKSKLMRYKWYRVLFGKKRKDCRSAFPGFIKKTDETRIQDAPFYLKDKQECGYVATEKIDGTSATYALLKRGGLHLPKNRYEFFVCSRNRRLPVNDGSAYWEIAEKYDIEKKLRNMICGMKWIAIQGEIIGPKIQGNKYFRKENDIFFFNLITEGRERQGSVAARDYLGTRGLQFVPIVDSNYALPDTVDEVMSDAHGKSVLAPTLREGLVIRSKDGKVSFKAVDPEFLLKYGM